MAIARTTKKSQETIEVNISDITFIKTTLTNLTLKVDGVEKTCGIKYFKNGKCN